MTALRFPRTLGFPRTLAATALALSLAGASLLTPAPVGAATGDVGWTVQTVDGEGGAGRGSFSYDLDPGVTVADAMRVVNTGTVALPLDVYAADAFTTAGGDIDLLVGGEPSVDAGLWVTVDTPQITLQPGEQTDIAFTISVPADASPGDHAAGLVTSLAGSSDGQALSVDRRLGTRVNVRVSGDLVPAAQIENVRTSYAGSWNPFEPGTLTVDYAVRNAGNTRISATDTVDAAGPAGLLATVADGGRLPEIIPGSVVEVRRELRVVSLGWLSGSVDLSPEAVGLGAAILEPVTTDYSALAVPWSLLALLVLIGAGTVGVIVVVGRARRRSADPQTPTADAPNPAP